MSVLDYLKGISEVVVWGIRLNEKVNNKCVM